VLAPMEGVERTNVEIVYLIQRVEFTQQNPYIMEVDCTNMNYYNCRGFSHLARNCRNRRTENRIREERRLEYEERRMIERGNKQSSNLNEEGDLIVFD